MNEICIGCGAKIQTKDPKKLGYIDKIVLEKRSEDFYCQRCFTLKHYNRNIEYPLESESYQKIIEMISEDDGLIVYVCDAIDFEETLIPDLNKIYNSKNILIIANKVDLFMRPLNINKMEMHMRSYLKHQKIAYQELLLISSFKEDDIINLIDQINTYRNHKNVYFIGMTNVGKSSLINSIIKLHTNIDNLITVSNLINTTLDSISIPFDDNSYIIDTPGIVNKYALNNYLHKDTLELITPNSYIKPKSFQLNSEQTLFIAGFVRLDFIVGSKSSFITYFRNDLLIHRTKLENADSFYEMHSEDILKIPTKNEIARLGNSTERMINFSINNNIDIVIPGLGFVSIHGEGELKIKTFERIKFFIRKAVL